MYYLKWSNTPTVSLPQKPQQQSCPPPAILEEQSDPMTINFYLLLNGLFILVR